MTEGVGAKGQALSAVDSVQGAGEGGEGVGCML